MLSLISIVLSSIALIPLLVYLLHWKFYSPQPFVRVSGEQSGEPIQIAEKGKIFFAVSTRSGHRSVLSEVWVSFDPDEADLFGTRGAEQSGIVDNRFPFALLFPEKRIVVKTHLQGNYFDYEAKKPKLSVKFIVSSQIETAELPFLLNMFPARRIRTERIVRFEVTREHTASLQRDGLALLPKESIHVEGVQSQGAWHAATAKGTGILKVREIISDRESQ